MKKPFWTEKNKANAIVIGIVVVAAACNAHEPAGWIIIAAAVIFAILVVAED